MSSDAELKLSEYVSLNPTQYWVLKSLSWMQELDSYENRVHQNLMIILAKNWQLAGKMLHLYLLDVRDLRLEQPAMGGGTFPLIDIVLSPSDRSFVGKYAVIDPENGVFACSCEDFFAYIQ